MPAMGCLISCCPYTLVSRPQPEAWGIQPTPSQAELAAKAEQEAREKEAKEKVETEARSVP